MSESWPENQITLDDVCHFIVDSEHKTAPMQDVGFPMIRTPNIGPGYFIMDGVRRVSEETYRGWTRRGRPQAGDLILAREAPVGNVAMVKPGMIVCLGQRTVLIRPNSLVVEPAYLTYLLLGDEAQGHFSSVANGATIHHLNLKDLRSMVLPVLPDLVTQRKIAGVLSAYDDLIENNTRRIVLLEEMARALYREWFMEFRFPGHVTAEFVEDEQGRRPRVWEQIPFTLVASVLSGGTPKTGEARYWDGGIPFYTPKDSPDGFYVIDTEKTLTGLGLEKCNSQLYPKDTVFITARGTVGKLALASEDMAMNQSCYALVGRRGIPQHYLFLLTQVLVGGFKQQANGAVFDAITVASFDNTKVFRPSDELLASFSTAVGPLFAASLSLTQRNANLRRTRDLLLPRLISGELDVSDLDIRLCGSAINSSYVAEDDQFEQATA